MKNSIKSNRLQHETSPYLLQHAQNPWTGIHGARRHLSGQNMRISQYS